MTPEAQNQFRASTWERITKMFFRRHVGLIGFAWCTLFFLSVMSAASGVLQPVAFAMASSVTSNFLPRDENGHTNILLLGIGDKNHPGASLTDSIIIASIDPDAQSIVFLSLPRDLYLVDSPNAPDARINALYANVRNRLIRGGMTASGASTMAMGVMAEEVGSKLGVTLHGVIKVDFTAFRDIVDAFGGVDIDVAHALTDYTYPVKEGVIGTFSLPAGPQHLDGDTALKYARSRHSTSDFDRSSRQQQILGALVEKAKHQNPLENLGLARSVLSVIHKHAEWTLSSGNLISLAGAVLTIPRENIISRNMNTSVGGDFFAAESGGFVRLPAEDLGAGAILLPYSLSGKLSDWGQLKTFANLLFVHRELYIAGSLITLEAPPKARVAAYRFRNELLRNGFSVAKGSEHSTRSGSGEIFVSSKSPSSEFLSSYLGLPLTMSGSMPDSTIRISLPKEYRFVPFEKALDL